MKNSEFHSFRRIFSAFFLMSSTTLISIVISALSSKVISVVAGTSGVGITGMFRNLGALVAGAATLGYTTLIAQKVSVSKKDEDLNDIISAASVLFGIQAFVIGCVALIFHKPIAALVFGREVTTGESWVVAIVLIMALAKILLETVVAILRGSANLKCLSFVQLLTAGTTLTLIYPLLKLGNLGLALNVGTGSLIGAAAGLWFIRKNRRRAFHPGRFAQGWKVLRETSLPSLLVTFQTVMTLGALFSVQSLISRHYGLDLLGNYNAALLILDTGTLLLMSSVRSFFLPGLGKLEEGPEKIVFIRDTVRMLLVFAIAGMLIIIFAGQWIIPILFSSQFKEANTLLSVLSLSLFGLVYCWSYNTFYLHQGKHLHFVCIDSLWAVLLVSFGYLAIYLKLPLVTMAWAYTLSMWASGLMYQCMVVKTDGFRYAGLSNFALAIFGVGLGFAAIELQSRHSILLNASFLCLVLATLAFVLIRQLPWTTRELAESSG